MSIHPSYPRALAALALLLTLNTAAAVPGNWLEERRQAERLAGALPEREVVRLDSGDFEFLALYRGADIATIRGAAILLHDIGGHPDWPDVIHPLRTQLPDAGWATLSIQIPAIRPGQVESQAADLVEDIGRRIRAAVAYLRDKGKLNMVVIGHGLGGELAARFIADTADTGSRIKALVGIGLDSRGGATSALAAGDSLARLQLPVLDILGTLHSGPVTEVAEARRQVALQSENTAYRQLKLPAPPDFAGRERMLVARVASWLKVTAPGGKLGNNQPKPN